MNHETIFTTHTKKKRKKKKMKTLSHEAFSARTVQKTTETAQFVYGTEDI